MSPGRVHERLYLANATVLLTHQMDAAFWHEWELFGMPGGIQLFLVLNLPIVLVVLLGARRPGGAYSWILAGSGLFAAAFHGVHLLRGDPAFTLPVSLALLAATALLSIAQALLLLGSRRQARIGGAEGPLANPPGLR